MFRERSIRRYRMAKEDWMERLESLVSDEGTPKHFRLVVADEPDAIQTRPRMTSAVD